MTHKERLLAAGWKVAGVCSDGFAQTINGWYVFITPDPGRGWMWCLRKTAKGGNFEYGLDCRNALQAAKQAKAAAEQLG